MYEFDFKMKVLYLFPEIIVVSLVSFFKYTYSEVPTYIFTHMFKQKRYVLLCIYYFVAFLNLI